MSTGLAKIKALRKKRITRARIAAIIGCRISTIDRALRRGALSENMEARVKQKLTATAIKRSEGHQAFGGRQGPQLIQRARNSPGRGLRTPAFSFSPLAGVPAPRNARLASLLEGGAGRSSAERREALGRTDSVDGWYNAEGGR